MKIQNVTHKETLAGKVRTANGFFERLKGLIGTSGLGPGEGLFIPKCQGIHTFGMAYAIDVVFVDKENRVVHTEEKLEPNRVGPTIWKASGVLELAAGTLCNKIIHKGDQLKLTAA